MINRIKGTQDIIDSRYFLHIVHALQRHIDTYNFSEIILPIIEAGELFQRSLGAETDVVNKEMFYIKTADDKESICLRPEATASIMRACIENGIDNFPWKVFTTGAMFRYERPQKGRFRQFHQVSMEIIGAQSLAHDVELICMLDRFFRDTLALPSFALVLNFLGCPQDRTDFKQKLYAYLKDNHVQELCPQCVVRLEKNVLRVFDCKNEQCQAIYAHAPHITQHLCTQCSEEWVDLKKQLHMLSVSYVEKPTLVRGLDYYSKTVFEFVSTQLGAQNAFCAGGRYDQLAKELGAKQDYPSIGAAIGIERIELMMRESESAIPKSHESLAVILPLSAQQHTLGLLLADELRAQQVTTDILFEGSMKSMMRKADKKAARFVLIIGSEEQEKGIIKVKDMRSGSEYDIKQSEIVEFLQESRTRK